MSRRLIQALAILSVLVWALNPLLACTFSARQMTMEEMACCKKMAGDCSMAAGRHPCCKTTIESNRVPIGAAGKVVRVQPPNAASFDLAAMQPMIPVVADLVAPSEGLSPPAPPGRISILRI
jgi:hypothetical protein